MLRVANSIYSPHFEFGSSKRSLLERATCHLAACSDNNANLLAFESTFLVGRPFDDRHFNFSCLEAWYVYSPELY